MSACLRIVAICAMPLGGAVLFFSIARILRLLRESEVARLPAATEANVTFRASISCQCQRLPWAIAPIIASNNVTTAPPFLPACRWNVARNIMTATMLAT